MDDEIEWLRKSKDVESESWHSKTDSTVQETLNTNLLYENEGECTYSNASDASPQRKNKKRYLSVLSKSNEISDSAEINICLSRELSTRPYNKSEFETNPVDFNTFSPFSRRKKLSITHDKISHDMFCADLEKRSCDNIRLPDTSSQTQHSDFVLDKKKPFYHNTEKEVQFGADRRDAPQSFHSVSELSNSENYLKTTTDKTYITTSNFHNILPVNGNSNPKSDFHTIEKTNDNAIRETNDKIGKHNDTISGQTLNHSNSQANDISKSKQYFDSVRFSNENKNPLSLHTNRKSHDDKSQKNHDDLIRKKNDTENGKLLNDSKHKSSDDKGSVYYNRKTKDTLGRITSDTSNRSTIDSNQKKNSDKDPNVIESSLNNPKVLATKSVHKRNLQTNVNSGLSPKSSSLLPNRNTYSSFMAYRDTQPFTDSVESLSSSRSFLPKSLISSPILPDRNRNRIRNEHHGVSTFQRTETITNYAFDFSQSAYSLQHKASPHFIFLRTVIEVEKIGVEYVGVRVGENNMINSPYRSSVLNPFRTRHLTNEEIMALVSILDSHSSFVQEMSLRKEENLIQIPSGAEIFANEICLERLKNHHTIVGSHKLFALTDNLNNEDIAGENSNIFEQIASSYISEYDAFRVNQNRICVFDENINRCRNNTINVVVRLRPIEHIIIGNSTEDSQKQTGQFTEAILPLNDGSKEVYTSATVGIYDSRMLPADLVSYPTYPLTGLHQYFVFTVHGSLVTSLTL